MSGWYRLFFQCVDKDDCGFVFTLIGQEGLRDEVDMCPACGSTIDYAYNENRKTFAKELLNELKIMEAEGELE